MKAYERLIRYARVHTSSAEGSDTVPSTMRQFDLAHMLEQELNELGFSEVFVDTHAYVYGALPATAGMENRPSVALIAHLDTIPDEDFSGENVQPQLVEHYDGGDLTLGTSGRVLSPKQFPDLKGCVGHTLITTDGTTVLGADDKAGIAEILTACEEILREGLPHGADRRVLHARRGDRARRGAAGSGAPRRGLCLHRGRRRAGGDQFRDLQRRRRDRRDHGRERPPRRRQGQNAQRRPRRHGVRRPAPRRRASRAHRGL